jgi:hypothetical protein
MIATCPFARPCLIRRQEGKLAMARKAKLFAEDDSSGGRWLAKDVETIL